MVLQLTADNIVTACMSNSILIWFDFLGSLSAVLHSAFAFLVIISVEIMG